MPNFIILEQKRKLYYDITENMINYIFYNELLETMSSQTKPLFFDSHFNCVP